MGYRTWNNYEEAAEQERRAAWAALPARTRLTIRLRQFSILAVVLGVVAGIGARIAGLF